MPLSEEELRLLEQMERALVEEDPKLASTLRGTTLRSAARRRAIAAGALFVVGVVVLMTGVISELPVVGIAGFVIMLASVFVFMRAMRRRATVDRPVTGPAPPAGGSAPAGQRRQGGSSKGGVDAWWGRMTERWRSRWEERGGGQGPP